MSYEVNLGLTLRAKKPYRSRTPTPRRRVSLNLREQSLLKAWTVLVYVHTSDTLSRNLQSFWNRSRTSTPSPPPPRRRDVIVDCDKNSAMCRDLVYGSMAV
jgi:hypothetical protein